MKTAFLFVVTTLFLLFPVEHSAASNGQKSLADAIKSYQLAKFGRAKEILIPLITGENEDVVIQKALVYLALIEIAHQNSDQADSYIQTLLTRYPSTDIAAVRTLSRDITPAFLEHFKEVLKKVDTVPPSAEIHNIQEDYNTGELIHVAISARDNVSLKSISFSVQERDILREWAVEGKSVNVEHSFSTLDWSEGVYRYQVRISDQVGNLREYEGTFAIIKPLDTRKPTAEISDFEQNDSQGETVRVSIRAEDDRGLKGLQFVVEGTDISREWAIEGKTANVTYTFNTQTIGEGKYFYRLIVSDASGNSSEYEGEILIGTALDTIRPTAEMSQIRGRYRQGDTIDIEIEARDDRSLKAVAFRVLKTGTAKEWTVEGKSAKVRYRFSTKGWVHGVYRYQVEVSDQEGNRSENSGSFTLTDESRYGYVNIFSKPWAEIFINGKSYGLTPKAKLKLPAGRVTVRFINEEQGINTARTITIQPDQLSRESFEFEAKAEAPILQGDGYLNIVSKPWTEIFINGKSYGRTPKARLKLPSGRVAVRFVNREKGIDATRSITILPNQLVKKSFDFK